MLSEVGSNDKETVAVTGKLANSCDSEMSKQWQYYFRSFHNFVSCNVSENLNLAQFDAQKSQQVAVIAVPNTRIEIRWMIQ